MKWIGRVSLPHRRYRRGPSLSLSLSRALLYGTWIGGNGNFLSYLWML